MACVVRNCITMVGIADSLPLQPVDFKEFTVTEIVKVPSQKPDIEHVVSVAVDSQIASLKIAETPVGTSSEGEILTGRKLIVELLLKQQIKYVADEPTQTVHAVHNEFLVSEFVVIPPTVATTTVEELLAQNRITVVPYIEDIYASMVDKRTICKNITILLDVIFKGSSAPAYFFK